MPSPVDKYFEQVKKDNPSYTDEQAWATAWSIYCKYKNPGSEHCTMAPSEYLKGKSAANIMERMQLLSAFQVLSMGSSGGYGISARQARDVIEKVTGVYIDDETFPPKGLSVDQYVAWLKKYAAAGGESVNFTASTNPLRAFQDALITRNVVARVLSAREFWKPVMDEDPKKVGIAWVRPGNQRDGESHAFQEATFEDGSTVVDNVSLCGKKFQSSAITKARAHGNTSSEVCPKCKSKAKDKTAAAKTKKLPSQGTTQRWAVMDGDKTLGFVEKTRRSTATRLEPFHAFIGDGKDEKSVGTFYDDKEKDRIPEKDQGKFKWGGFDAAVEAVTKAAK